LALLEFPLGLIAAQLAAGFGSAGALPVHGRSEESFSARLEALPGGAQRLLLVAAADPTGDPALLRDYRNRRQSRAWPEAAADPEIMGRDRVEASTREVDRAHGLDTAGGR
jgi:hypothetical protein